MWKLSVALLGASLLVSARAEAFLCTPVPNSNPLISQAWNQRCVPYFISRAGTLFDGEARRQLILQSFRVWSTPNCTDLSFMDFGYTDQEPGFNPARTDNQNIVVAIENDSDARDIFTRNELAITITSFNTATGEIFDADIMINAASFPFDDLASTDACKQRAAPLPYDLRNTLVHEIGHFIGFDHDLLDPESTMFASAPECETKKRDLTADNVQGVCNVYGNGSPTMTCSPPATYDQGPGNPSAFRDQCNLTMEDGGGCRCSGAGSSGSEGALLLLVGAGLLMRRRRRVSGR